MEPKKASSLREKLAGNYQGWMREPGSSWEDLIGVVKVAFDEESSNQFTIRTIEFGNWKGTISGETKLVGLTHEANVSFDFAIRERPVAGGRQIVLEGTIYEDPAHPIYEVLFTKTPQ